jgi:hypothetical protein
MLQLKPRVHRIMFWPVPNQVGKVGDWFMMLAAGVVNQMLAHALKLLLRVMR